MWVQLPFSTPNHIDKSFTSLYLFCQYKTKVVIVKIDLTKDQLNSILEWFNCYQNEGSITNEDKELANKIDHYFLLVSRPTQAQADVVK